MVSGRETERIRDAAVRRAFVVVGMHRSGTSAMSRTLSLLGAHLPKGLIPPQPGDNETGFWEPQSIAELNDEILQAQDSDWDDVFAFQPRRYLSNFDNFYLGRAVDLLQEEFNGSEVIVLKDPRISVLTSFWHRALTEAEYEITYIVMVRNPLEVADSLRERNSFPREKSLLLWSSYMIAAERDTRGRNRIFVSYEQLLHDWREVRRRIEDRGGFPFPRDTSASGNQIDRYLNRSLRHHHATAEEFFSRSDVPDQVKALYRIFAAACDEAELDEAALKAIRVDLEKIESLVGPLLADLRASARALTKEVTQLAASNANASEQARDFGDELARERAARQAELEASARRTADYELRVRELTDQMQQAEVKDALRQAEREAEVRAAEREAAARARAQYEWRLAKLAKRVAGSADELARVKREFDDKLDAERRSERDTAREEIVRVREKAERELERASTDLRLAREACEKAERDLSANNEKLKGRYEELATLATFLREQEHRSDDLAEQLRWLSAANQHILSRPRWWNLMPRRWQQRRMRQKFEAAGLFDGEEYLLSHPDVRAAGIDPLEHYLRHGLKEGRRLLVRAGNLK